MQAHRGLKHLDLMRAVVRIGGLFYVGQDPVGAVLYFQKTHVWCGQGRFEQAFQHFVVAGNHPVLGGGRQLIGDQLPGVIELLP